MTESAVATVVTEVSSRIPPEMIAELHNYPSRQKYRAGIEDLISFLEHRATALESRVAALEVQVAVKSTTEG